MSIMDKLKKNSKIKDTSILSDSVLFAEKDITVTNVPMVNVALSGDIDGGLTSGLTVLAGPSKHFKTSFALLMGAAYLKQHEDAVMLFYDSEFGSPNLISNHLALILKEYCIHQSKMSNNLSSIW